MITHKEEHYLFFSELGLAICEWASIEEKLFEVLQCCVKDTERKRIRNAFYSIQSLQAKLAFVDAIVIASPNSTKFRRGWRSISAQISSLSVKRNLLAHSKVVAALKMRPGRVHLLVPSVSDPTNPKAICLTDIVKIRHDFSILAQRINQFVRLLSGQSIQPVRSGPPLENQKIMRHLRDQIRAALPRHDPTSHS
jgi:hypothetical protein